MDQTFMKERAVLPLVLSMALPMMHASVKLISRKYLNSVQSGLVFNQPPPAAA